ncbi:hypothetical protein Vadar_001477 [Vaccinium darrowii]|uniref:Uncharacterized protein n=1 Tax=Vaccinium darrowii TaxID=229202 RepID=A0ACB7YSI4_9ERIC|nr:hypothetical protein Vadar_001477 [Vaccinium darrowii]
MPFINRASQMAALAMGGRQLLKEMNLNEFWIPKFKFSFGFDVLKIMDDMGKSLSLNPRDLSEMIHNSGDAPIFISKMFQKAYIEMAKGKGWPMKVKHELHEHELELTQRSRYCTCDGCEEQGEVWFFCCKDCNFDLHPNCALEENKANKGDNKDGLEEGATTKGWPKKVKHELHEHELELIERRNYICDGCKEQGKLWFFYCKDCNFYLHRKCALE